MKLTKEQAAIAATMCKLAVVSQIGKAPAKRDPALRGVSFASMEDVVSALEAIAEGSK